MNFWLLDSLQVLFREQIIAGLFSESNDFSFTFANDNNPTSKNNSAPKDPNNAAHNIKKIPTSVSVEKFGTFKEDYFVDL
jgi:hypothetical protein